MPRRDFLKTVPAAAYALSQSGGLALAAEAGPQSKGAPARFVGIQMGPHTMLDEGIERCLDLVQETAAVNALLVYSHAYNGDLRKGPQALAQDHGGPPRDNRRRRFPMVWVRHHESTSLTRRCATSRLAKILNTRTATCSRN